MHYLQLIAYATTEKTQYLSQHRTKKQNLLTYNFNLIIYKPSAKSMQTFL